MKITDDMVEAFEEAFFGGSPLTNSESVGIGRGNGVMVRGKRDVASALTAALGAQEPPMEDMLARRYQIQLVEQRVDGQWFARVIPVYPDRRLPAVLMPAGGFFHGLGQTIDAAIRNAMADAEGGEQ